MSKAMDAAVAKGRKAAQEGKPRSANPYGDDRTWNGGVTYARAFWKRWNEGWEEVIKSWYCDPCSVEVYDRRCPHCGKTKREKT